MIRPGLVIAASVALAHASWAQVELRGQRAPIPGAVTGLSVEGVTVRDPSGTEQVIGWDRVRSVRGDGTAAAAPFLLIADSAWRARSRLERGDVPAAEPLYEELFSAYRDAAGPTAAAVDEGLLRCRLARGATGAAIWPWLAWTACLDQAGAARTQQWLGGSVSLPPLRDEATALVGSLPPIMLPDRATLALAAAPEWGAVRRSDPTAGALADLYRRAVLFEAGEPLDAMPPLQSGRGEADHPGIRLVAEIVMARTGEREQRRSARAMLEQRIRSLNPASKEPAWTEAWCRAAIGRSLLREDDVRDRRRGVTQLLHVPARFGDDLPHLAALSLAQAAVAMKELGDTASAGILAEELRRRYPDHPVQEWDRLLDLGGGGGGGGPASRPITDGDLPNNDADAPPK